MVGLNIRVTSSPSLITLMPPLIEDSSSGTTTSSALLVAVTLSPTGVAPLLSSGAMCQSHFTVVVVSFDDDAGVNNVLDFICVANYEYLLE
mgnify:CR=1 FL=1